MIPLSVVLRLLGVVGLFVVTVPISAQDASAIEKPVDFNREVLPLLSGRCFRCHGPDEETVEAGLRLDLRKHAVAKLESESTAVVPGKPDASELLKRVTSDDEFERMPPAEAGKPLTKAEVDLLRRWIAQGADYEQHWSYIPPKKFTPPTNVSQPEWVKNSIDAFVLQRLDREKLTPNDQAAKAALIRRVTLDLTGLPPTIAEVDAFLADDQPGAYERVVDRLLTSPRYGERWARIWLDVARYADSAGYAQDPARTIWRYRDWVIDAYNQNLSFKDFTIEQLAGDMLPNPTNDQLIATAFHRNTMTNSEGGTDDEEFRTAAVVDRTNTTMQAWMGLTWGCAQCHTHKYDPITQTEYFQLYAVFNNTEDADRANEAPTLSTTTAEQELLRSSLDQQIAKLDEIVEKEQQGKPTPQSIPTGPLKPRYIRIQHTGKGVFLSLAEVQVFAGETNVALKGKASQVSTGFGGDAKLAIDGNTSGEYEADKSTTHTNSENEPWWEVDLGREVSGINKIVLWNRTDNNLQSRLNGFRVIALDAKRKPLFVQTVKQVPNPSFTATPPTEAKDLTAAQKKEIATLASRTPTGRESAAERQLNQLKRQRAAIKPVPTPILRELPEGKRRKTHIQIRGNFLDKGKEVTAGVPSAFHPLPDGMTPNRLTVANWLVDTKNPLTARVTVNRFWEHLFGIGLVETSEDFGLQGEPPVHPELLDFLAHELMRTDWDTKQLVRLIVTSATYRQSSKVSDSLQARDPYNRLFARGPRFRISAEMVRDQALFVSGLLSQKMKGESVRPPRPNLGLRAAFGGSTDWQPSPGDDKYRRGLYTSWRRTTPYPSMTTFDAPSREVCTIRRIRTNTPLQALVTLNDPVYVEASQALARRIVTEGGNTIEEQVSFGFRLCLARQPSEAERTRLVNLYHKAFSIYQHHPEEAKLMATDPLGPLPAEMKPTELAAWTVVGNVLLNLDEMLARQ